MRRVERLGTGRPRIVYCFGMMIFVLWEDRVEEHAFREERGEAKVWQSRVVTQPRSTMTRVGKKATARPIKGRVQIQVDQNRAMDRVIEDCQGKGGGGTRWSSAARCVEHLLSELEIGCTSSISDSRGNRQLQGCLSQAA